jgi:DNA-binding MarR family transcriptional regulator
MRDISTHRHTATESPAVEACRLIFGNFFSRRDSFVHTAESFGLRPSDMKALLSLEQPRPMRDLAETMACDPSTITGVVDRLEEEGFVERQMSVDDRRIKLLALTPAGLAMRDKVLAKLFTPPDELLALPQADQRALRDILRRAFDA